MKFTKWIAAALAGLCMLSGCGMSDYIDTKNATVTESTATEAPVVSATPASAKDSTEGQTQLILSLQDQWKSTDPYNDWNYCITDLDHNGRLEVITASLQGTGLYTVANFYEVNESFDGLNAIANPLAEGDSGPDLIQNSAACYLDTSSNIYYYEFFDTLRVSAAESISTIYVVYLKDGVLWEVPLAHQDDTYITDTDKKSVFTDASGNEITQQDYYNAANNFFKSMQKQDTFTLNWTVVPAEKPMVSSSVAADSLFEGYGFYHEMCSETGLYTFTPVNSDGVEWKIYILDEEFTDAERYIPQAYSAALSGSGSVEIYNGQWIYVYCPCNSWTMLTAPDGCCMNWTMDPSIAVSGSQQSYRVNFSSEETSSTISESNLYSGGIVITKNPSGECLAIGGKNWFIAHADNADSLTWYCIDTAGTEHSLEDTVALNPGLGLQALDGDTLAVTSAPISFNGWSVIARFSNSSGSVTTEPATIYVGDYLKSYDSVIKYYETLEKNGNDASSEFDIFSDLDMADLGYKLKDLDGDGSPEMIVAQTQGSSGEWEWDSIIYSVWTLKDGSPANVLYSIARNRYYYSSQGFYNEGSDSAIYTVNRIFQVNGTDCIFVDGVCYDGNATSPWFTLKDSQTVSTQISETEYNTKITNYESSLISLGQLNPI